MPWDGSRIAMLAVLASFYLVYLGKMWLLRRKGIRANLMGKGRKPPLVFLAEVALRVVTLLGAAIQAGSVLFPTLVFSLYDVAWLRWAGAAIACVGCVFFTASVIAMQDQWRAGFNYEQKTKLVTRGIYRYSRNPAFVGFDLLYVGCALAFPNIANGAVALVAVLLFHKQIRGEEIYLRFSFDESYMDYAACTARYIGWKRRKKERVKGNRKKRKGRLKGLSRW